MTRIAFEAALAVLRELERETPGAMLITYGPYATLALDAPTPEQAGAWAAAAVRAGLPMVASSRLDITIRCESLAAQAVG